MIFNCTDVNESINYIEYVKTALYKVLEKKYLRTDFNIVDFYGGKDAIRVWVKLYTNSYNRHLVKWEDINEVL